jgi:hypothetical protein
MGNQVTLTFAGDADSLAKESKKASAVVDDFGKSAKAAGDDLEKSGKKSMDFTDKIGKLGAGVSGMSDAIGNASGILDDFNQIQNASYEKSQKQKRALLDVQQAQEDYNQAVRDSRQAVIDAGQAQIDKQQADLDAAAALKQYNEDVKEHGKNSLEAAQDLLDLKQAHQDATQAVEDGNQAQRDANQATIDAKTAQLDLNDAQRESHPTDLQKFSQQLQTYAPLLQGLVGIVALVTAAQWAWNAAQLASPTTWIVAGIVALIAIVVLLVKHWDWVKKAGAAAWDWIKKAASNTWDFLKKIPGWIGDAFKFIANAIFWPYKTAFNLIADAWNNTVGRLEWTVPGWVPGIGGNHIGVPHIPRFHTGGTVPGPIGQEQLAILQGGETVSSNSGGTTVMQIPRGALLSGDALVEAISKVVRRNGGNVQLVLGGKNA